MGKLIRNNINYTGQVAVYGGFTPVGSIISIMSNHAPANYLICDGTTYNITDYPELANHFRTEFGSVNKFGGDGTTTFAVPDLRGEFLRGTGTNGHTNQGNGASVGTHQDATYIKPLSMSDSSTKAVQVNDIGAWDWLVGNHDSQIKGSNKTNTRVIGSSYSTFVQSGEESIRETVRPTSTSVLYCIAYKNIYIESGGGTGGHTILDNDGNTMPAEDNLQFKGLDVADNSTDGVTEVESAGLNQDSMDDVLSASASGTQVASDGMSCSTEEQVVGRWVDGKPIYQKTYFAAGPYGAGSHTIISDINSSWGIDQVVDISAVMAPTNHSGTFVQVGNAFANNNDAIGIDQGNLLFIKQSTGATWKAYVTIKYTKTTD